jgi:hypothetical protein
MAVIIMVWLVAGGGNLPQYAGFCSAANGEVTAIHASQLSHCPQTTLSRESSITLGRRKSAEGLRTMEHRSVPDIRSVTATSGEVELRSVRTGLV